MTVPAEQNGLITAYDIAVHIEQVFPADHLAAATILPKIPDAALQDFSEKNIWKFSKSQPISVCQRCFGEEKFIKNREKELLFASRKAHFFLSEIEFLTQLLLSDSPGFQDLRRDFRQGFVSASIYRKN